MKSTPFVFWLAGAAMTVVAARGAEDSLVTAVFAKTHNGYQREMSADGTPARQTYVVGKGTYQSGLRRDGSIDNVQFSGVVRALAPYLARQNFMPAPDKQTADLILVLHWGVTTPWDDGTHRQFMNVATEAMKGVQSQGFLPGQASNFSPADQETMGVVMAAAKNDLYQSLMMVDLMNRIRDQANQHNANLLGYMDEINRRNDITRYVGLGTAFDDLIQDLEEERYYVVIGAYDFQEVLKGRHTLLWSTRVSIREQGNRFDQWLPAMFANASNYFGRESKRLVRQFQRASSVELGELKSLGIVEDEEVPEK